MTRMMHVVPNTSIAGGIVFVFQMAMQKFNRDKMGFLVRVIMIANSAWGD
jgi:hypothetical protein